MKKTFAVMIVLGLMLAMFSSSFALAESNEMTGELRVSIEAWILGKFPIEEKTKEFEANHPGVSVAFSMVEGEDVTTNLLQWSQGQTNCDLSVGPAIDDALKYAQAGYIIDYGEDFFTGDYAEENFVQSLLNVNYIDGKCYVIPYTGEFQVISYNKTLAKEAGLLDENGNIPAVDNWDELYEYAKIANEKTGKIGLSIAWGSNHMTYNYLASLQGLKGTIYGDDGKTVDFTSDYAKEVLTQWHRLVADGLTPTETFADNDAGRTNFKSGNIVLHMSGVSRAIEFEQTLGMGNVGVLMIPGTQKNGSIAYASGCVIPVFSEKQELAKAFIKEVILASEVQSSAMTKYGKMSPMLRDYSDLESKIWEVVVTTLDMHATPPLYSDYVELDEGLMNPELQKIILGVDSIEDGMKTLSDGIAELDLSSSLE